MEIKAIDLDKMDPVSPKSAPGYSTANADPRISPSPVIKKSMSSKKQQIFTVITFLIVATAGIYTGAYFKNRGMRTVSSDLKNIQAEVPSTVKVGDIYGSPDEKAFNTTATGVLDKGGMNGEGTHKLVRPGGPSQTVYLTSSVIDLDTLVGHQVTVWGETFKGQKAGWLMDVGRVRVENLNMPLPK